MKRLQREMEEEKRALKEKKKEEKRLQKQREKEEKQRAGSAKKDCNNNGRPQLVLCIMPKSSQSAG